MAKVKFNGYRRENGKVGIRNHVAILPLDDLSNAVCQAVENNIKGTIALPHAYGRLQFGPDLELLFRTLIGTGSNPNISSVVVVGIEPDWTNHIVEGIAKTGKPVEGLSIERHGDITTIAEASRVAKEYVQWSSELQREECPIEDLYVSVKCGESDTTSGLASCPTVGEVLDRLQDMGATMSFGETSEITGAEDICASRAGSDKAREDYMRMFDDYTKMITDTGADLLGSQPTKGNIRGGLTTIEEKALGNLQKIGKKCKYVGCLEPAEAPTGKGLWYMDTSSAAAEAVTLWAASGAVVHLFPTGQGNVIGHPIEPVIKLSANPLTCETMSEHIDVDVSGLLRREINLEQAGDMLFENMIRTCNGRLTCAEVLGHREFVMTKLYRSA